MMGSDGVSTRAYLTGAGLILRRRTIALLEAAVERAVGGPAEEPLLDDDFAGSDPDPESALIDRETQDDILARWRELLADDGPRQRQLLEAWHRKPDAPLAEIARELGITPAAARNAIARLRRRKG